MRETFPKKKPGDPLTAGHINMLGKLARRLSGQATGSHLTGVSGPVASAAKFAPFVQRIVTITDTSQSEDGIYGIRLRYYDYNEEGWVTKSDGPSYQLDGSEFDVTFSEDDKLIAYWDPQRRMFIPVSSLPKCNLLVDIKGGGHEVAKSTSGESTPSIFFALDIWSGDTWRSVNDRIYAVNGNFEMAGVDEDTPIEVSGTGIYTFLAPGNTQTFLRVTVLSELPQDVMLEFAAIRLEAKCKGGVSHTTGEPLPSHATWVHNLDFEAMVNNDQHAEDHPHVIIVSGSHMRLRVPTDDPWTIEAEVSCKFSERACGCECALCPRGMPCCALVVIEGTTNNDAEECCFCPLHDGAWLVRAHDTITCRLVGSACANAGKQPCTVYQWWVDFVVDGDGYYIKVMGIGPGDTLGQNPEVIWQSEKFDGTVNCCNLGEVTCTLQEGDFCEWPDNITVDFLTTSRDDCDTPENCVGSLENCTCCECANQPYYLTVELPDGWGASDCSENGDNKCPDAVGTFILEQQDATGPSCTYRYDFDTTGCDDVNSCCWRTIIATVSCGGGTTTVNISLGSDQGSVDWRTTLVGNKVSCAFEDLEVPFLSQTALNPCQWDSSTPISVSG